MSAIFSCSQNSRVGVVQALVVNDLDHRSDSLLLQLRSRDGGQRPVTQEERTIIAFRSVVIELQGLPVMVDWMTYSCAASLIVNGRTRTRQHQSELQYHDTCRSVIPVTDIDEAPPSAAIALDCVLCFEADFLPPQARWKDMSLSLYTPATTAHRSENSSIREKQVSLLSDDSCKKRNDRIRAIACDGWYVSMEMETCGRRCLSRSKQETSMLSLCLHFDVFGRCHIQRGRQLPCPCLTAESADLAGQPSSHVVHLMSAPASGSWFRCLYREHDSQDVAFY